MIAPLLGRQPTGFNSLTNRFAVCESLGSH
jgi:hypothetical protein